MKGGQPQAGEIKALEKQPFLTEVRGLQPQASPNSAANTYSGAAAGGYPPYYDRAAPGGSGWDRVAGSNRTALRAMCATFSTARSKPAAI